ncbi:sigma-70 family RNA polymerase sigma factor [Telmatocola sphagniphila]|uniref:Sigma-70 family RNA polymerase sigma factor n=1 Tax=Telmatocola sphagniphila TaxID=1123043 RepID=A0A8E6EWI6_9BACT|nr:ECF-type sigma factor [Telmatocola sphagniphila]QVL33832.1 sigma-70 family RNA polymerase sigma factor [Telmatocola sphagniphila]
MTELTRILNDLNSGDLHASAKLLPLVYEELRKLASIRMNPESSDHTLSPTALVHEAYIRLVGAEDLPRWENRAHFFAAAATAMRRILIDRARRKSRAIHGGEHRRVAFSLDTILAVEPNEELLELDHALTKFAQKDPLKAQLVELRFFAGLTSDQVAAILGISPRSADRHWVYAQAWLRREILRSQDE